MNIDEIRLKAINEIEKRRLAAENEHELRKREVLAAIPEIGEIESRLTQTASELSKLIIYRQGSSSDSFVRLRDNSIQAQKMIKLALTSKGYPEDYLDMHYRCSVCHDTGFLEFGGRCDCFKRLAARIAAEELNRTANMPEADFAHFSLDYYRGVTINGVDCYEKMSQVLTFCIQYAESFSPSSQSVLMFGRTGTGKTHLSLSIAKEVMQKDFTVVYGSVMNFLRSIEKEHFGRSEENSDTLAVLLDCDLLVLDDLGSEHHTAFYESVLYNIINTRINLRKPVIVSSNLSISELSNAYNERIVSRLMCTYTTLAFYGKDIRQEKKFRE